ncbi:hypothetical protein B9T19_05060 [Ignatzschineria sp. F8392]|uniref:hypothetical protein n=1 Tax=Ignatzschineria sp. F8392 TaxID=1980117 RepID=UPI000B995BCA|nr:hypothetical protein [Ignatzschineria sp. F8392]OYQ80612.1 hypothetical protein B9T19_05060 [Ignatzschineria sp. F8392]
MRLQKTEADELPVLTIARFRRLRAGKGIKEANWRACIGEKNDIVGSRRSTDSLKNHKIIH